MNDEEAHSFGIRKGISDPFCVVFFCLLVATIFFKKQFFNFAV